MEKLSIQEWKNIFKNIKEDVKENGKNVYDEEWVTVMYLDPVTEKEDKWGLIYGEELFESGFQTEEEAYERLREIEKEILGGYYS